jgi:hypothetical protein
MIYGAFLMTADMISRVCGRLRFYDQSGSVLNKKRGWFKWALECCCIPCFERFLKPYVLFPAICALVIPVASAFVVFQYSIQIIFNAMILWRAYKIHISSNFVVDYLNPFLELVGTMLDMQVVVYVVSYPVVYVAQNIYFLSFNLDAIKVVCVGAQSTWFLLLDMFIVAAVVIIIESDLHVFWSMMVYPSATKMRSMFFSWHFLKDHFRSTLFYLLILIIVSLVPDPSKIVQYFLGFLEFQRFFSNGSEYGGWVNSSENCDNVIHLGNNSNLPMDSILANLSAIFVIIVFFPGTVNAYLFCVRNILSLILNAFMLYIVIFLLSVVLIEVNDKNKSICSSFGFFGKTKSFHDGEDLHRSLEASERAESTGEEHRTTGNTLSIEIDHNEEKKNENDANSNKIDEVDIDIRDSGKRTLEQDGNPNKGSSPVFLRKENKAFSTFRAEKSGSNIGSIASKVGRITFSFFALDCYVLKTFHILARSMFSVQQAFLLSEYKVFTLFQEEGQFRRKKVIEYKDAFDCEEELKDLRKWASHASPGSLALFDGFVNEKSAQRVADLIEEDIFWKDVKGMFPSFVDLSCDAYAEMAWMDMVGLFWARSFFCHCFPAQIYFTEVGRDSWKRVLRTYVGLVLFCLGVWPDWLATDFKIVEKFRKFRATHNAVYNRVNNDVVSFVRQDAFTKIDNEEKIIFGRFVAAVTTCRIALLQIVPVLTLWSLLASAVASTPMFVFNKEMNDMLPAMIATDAYKKAVLWLTEDYNGKRPGCLQCLFLTYYIFINQSRLILCCINGFLSFISVAIIFFPEQLQWMIPVMVVVMVHQGLLSGLYILLLFEKLIFPLEKQSNNDEYEDKQQQKQGGSNAAIEQNSINHLEIELMERAEHLDSPKNNTTAKNNSNRSTAGSVKHSPKSLGSHKFSRNISNSNIQNESPDPLQSSNEGAVGNENRPASSLWLRANLYGGEVSPTPEEKVDDDTKTDEATSASHPQSSLDKGNSVSPVVAVVQTQGFRQLKSFRI